MKLQKITFFEKNVILDNQIYKNKLQTDFFKM